MARISPQRCIFFACAATIALTLAPTASVTSADQAARARTKVLPGPHVIRVGRGLAVSKIAEAARIAQDGDTIEIEAGDYVGDVAVWAQPHLTIRGVNGRPRLIAGGASAQGKAIWVVRGEDIAIENIEFVGARVADKNGAGIRFEHGRLVIRNCRFEDNENGIMGGADDSELEIHNSEFVRNGAGDGYSHNIYVWGRRVLVHGNYISQSRVGHLLKSRAQESQILYNRLSGENGTSSYELEFPDGGIAVVVGNLIEQGPATENPTIVSFGAESLRLPRNELYLSHNTLVNDRPSGGVFVFARAGNASVVAVNNVSVGPGIWNLQARADLRGNVTLKPSDFANPERFDYRLLLRSRAPGNAVGTDSLSPFPLRPTEEYVHPAKTKKLGPFAPANPGAFQSIVP
jgi:hypothetical protein